MTDIIIYGLRKLERRKGEREGKRKIRGREKIRKRKKKCGERETNMKRDDSDDRPHDLWAPKVREEKEKRKENKESK